MIYLDHAATTPLLPEAKNAMLQAMDEYYANASALHTPGHLAHEKIESVRELLASIIHADPSEIIFTSSSTESNNTIINVFAGQKIAVSSIEHESIINAAKSLAEECRELEIDQSGFLKDFTPDGEKLISVMLASNEIGSIQDLAQLSQKAHRAGALVHSDMTQALGKIPINVKNLGVDYATFSAHKIGGPVGVGALYIKKGSPFHPFMIGGSQERHLRAGTYNTMAIAGFGAALQKIQELNTPKLYQEKIKPLRNELAERILREIPGSSLNIDVNSPQYLPNILNCSFRAAEGESIQLYLDAEGIIVSTGSACAAGDIKPSHVLMAKTHDAEVAHSSIRFSFGLSNTQADVEAVMLALPKIVKKLQGISTIKTQ